MPDLPQVISVLARALPSEEVKLGANPLREIGNVLLFLHAAGISLDDPSTIAALAAITLPAEEARKVVAGLGVSPALVPTVRPTTIGIGDQLTSVIEQGTRPEAVVAASLVYALCCDAAHSGEDFQIQSYRTWVEYSLASEH